MKKLPQDFADLLVELNEAEVDFVLVGGWAVILYGHVRGTDDMDIFVRANEENSLKVFAALQAFGAPLAAHGVGPTHFAREGVKSPAIIVVGEVVQELAEGAHIVPEMTSGFTDSRIYRLSGIPAYGFVPCLVPPEELAGVHGHNERISVENIRLGLQILYEVVRRLVAA